MNARTKTFIVGGTIGALLGVLAAWIYVRDRGEGEELGSLPRVKPGDALQVGLAALHLLRQVANLE